MTKYAKYTQTEAAARAKAKVGKATLKGKVGQCLAEQVNPANSSPYSIPAPWGFAGNGEDWAVNYWLNAVAKGKVVKTSDHAAVPKGALAFAIQKSEVGKAKPAKAGHVWTSDGASGMYTTDRPTNGKWGHVSTKSVLDAWGMVQLGYVIVTGDGYTLTDPPKTPTARVTAVWGKPDTWRIGSIGPDVTRLGQRLEVWAAHYGLPKPYTVGPSPEFTETDRRAVEAFQGKRGWTGTGADGFPGTETFKILATDPPTKPAPPVTTPKNTLTILTNNLWGYGKAPSSSTQSVRLPRFVAMVKHYMPDMVAVQELSNQGADKKKQAGDTVAKTPYHYVMDAMHDLGYAYDSIGSDGRYIFRRKSEVEFIKGKTILMTPEYKGDNKQAAIGAYSKGGRLFSLASAHTENEGSDDKYRVGQTKSLMAQMFAFAKPLGVDSRWQFYAGDFNDHDNVLAAFNARGYVDSFTRAPLAHRIKAAVQSFGSYLKVYNGKRIDLVTVYKDVAVVSAQQITAYADSDHHPQLVEIQL